MQELYSERIGLPGTDPKRWRLTTNELGRESWDYLNESDSEKVPQSTFTQWLLRSDDFPEPNPEVNSETPGFNAWNAAYNGGKYLTLLQDPESGIFPCQYKGPMFLTIGYVATMYISKREIPEHERIEMIRYVANYAHPVDGGWGLHNVDKSTVLGTVLNYVMVRLLGLPKDHEVCVRARDTLMRLGGAIGSPHWAKIWLSILNLYKWEGVNPAPPELWMLPYGLSIHPARWWVHTRGIYLPVSYLSSKQYSCELDPLLEEIRAEIYTKPFESINFKEHRNTVCGVDLYYPHSKVLDTLNYCMVKYEKYLRPAWLLKKSTKRVYEIVKTEIANTDYLCIAPVNMAFCAIVTMLEEGKDSEEFGKFLYRFKDVLFHGPQGLTVMGTNGVQVWDCAFYVQYMFMAGLAELPEFHDSVVRAFKFLCRSQFTEDCVEGSFRDKRLGAWPFSTKEQGYTVSDCTAEATKAVIMVLNSDKYKDVWKTYDTKKLENGIDVLLSLQNLSTFEYGSFATYEKIKAPLLMEALNPAEVFGNIMVEFPYVECTDSSLLGLTYFRRYFNYRKKDIDNSIEAGISFIKDAQASDGSWYGCWGICYTYAGMFALEALSTVGETYENSEVVRKGCDFLVSKQLEDGGWSETMKSSELHYYTSDKLSYCVQTAWVLVGLISANYPDKSVIDKGIELLKQRQQKSGEWKFEAVEGVFNHSCAIEYPSYRFLFPIKALGLYVKKYGKDAI
ncbi:unnamed protein product [Kluyveromyces dobzhanskii CBS 2104]|uniref:Terpene cyclase/mutase family member n=1 Tax=Kluyveromyces dobzhanskii CBS 2104 TaxID=1427455 RepID=A0A0A8L5B5_9SACH|nr:unnamed protein product [Kluyveromyces dobzhanskii CBS 2104]